MAHEVYLKHTQTFIIGISGPRYWGELHEHNFTDIMYCPEKEEADQNEGTKIGNLAWIIYKQELAIANGINMTHVPDIYLQFDFPILLELDYAHITRETIKQIGAASNSNIVILIDFFISSAWRNKGIGKEVLINFIEQMKGKCGYIIILRNEPMQFGRLSDPDYEYAKPVTELDSLEKDPEKAQYKLNAFWQRCGFKLFKDYDNVFICNVEQAVPDYSKAVRTSVS
ncbi:GNAT family N-acetyltransferase [Niastella sp. OAS944]|uniref:GNAT family N-acetyltransferase n=1 Tax=Niastella sp. OAS944 TaxID=2664089 RepID=UPI00348263C6|nr:GNAT superfamily N-acetyltransferase [Chitinophagaceae bacterium OAS944]